jgi:hypothetical protein
LDQSAEFIQKIVDLAPATQIEIHGLPYGTRDLTLISTPSAPALSVGTLDGFVNLLESGVDGFEVAESLIHITTYGCVDLVQSKADSYGRRIAHVTAQLTEGITTFPYFNRFGPQEDFIIGLQSHFQSTPDLAGLLDLASHITGKETVKQIDSGITQEVTVQRGSAFKESVEVKARVTLKPFRTFRELDQPASDFIFRVKDGAQLALFEADGGAWKIAAIGLISEWLRNRIKTSLVAELANLPIIS